MVGAFLYLVVRSPSQAAPSTIVVKTTPERLERGRYLFNNLLECDGCHSQRDFSRLGGPVVESGRGKGGPMNMEGLPEICTLPISLRIKKRASADGRR